MPACTERNTRAAGMCRNKTCCCGAARRGDAAPSPQLVADLVRPLLALPLHLQLRQLGRDPHGGCAVPPLVQVRLPLSVRLACARGVARRGRAWKGCEAPTCRPCATSLARAGRPHCAQGNCTCGTQPRVAARPLQACALLSPLHQAHPSSPPLMRISVPTEQTRMSGVSSGTSACGRRARPAAH